MWQNAGFCELCGSKVDTSEVVERQWVEPQNILKMVGGEVGVAHRHGDGRVTEYLLQHQNIATIHHKVAGESMPQHVGALPLRQLDTRPAYCCLKVVIALAEQLAPAFWNERFQLLVDRHSPAFSPLVWVKVNRFCATCAL